MMRSRASQPCSVSDLLPDLHRPRPGRGLWLTATSGGLLLWRAVRTVVSVARQAPSHRADARWLLVPGLRLSRGDLGGHFAARIERAYALWQRQRGCGFVLSGAATGRGARSEAEVALEHLIDLGLPHAAEVRLDHAARSTVENLERAQALLDGHGGGVVVVSNRYHLARIGWLVRARGLDWQLCAAEPAWRWRPSHVLAVLREAAVLVALAGAAAGRIDAHELLHATEHAA